MQRKILVIDDEPLTVELVEFLFTKNDYAVISAPYGSKGVELAQRELPDLILLDMMMPKMGGIEVCKLLKSNEKTKDIPVLFLSAIGQEIEVMQGLRAGGEGYIVKPFEPNDLLKQVEKILSETYRKEKNK